MLYVYTTTAFTTSMGKFIESQVKSHDGEWIDAVPIANTVLVFIDDIMQRWTADRLVATVQLQVSIVFVIDYYRHIAG